MYKLKTIDEKTMNKLACLVSRLWRIKRARIEWSNPEMRYISKAFYCYYYLNNIILVLKYKIKNLNLKHVVLYFLFS